MKNHVLGGYVSKNLFKNHLASWVMGATVLTASAFAADAPSTPQPQQSAPSFPQDDACTKEILLSYFPQQFVQEVLKDSNIPQDQWAGITTDLAAKDQTVITVIEQKASSMTPNPLKDPQQRAAVAKLFRETLTEMFSEVMKKHGVTDDKQIQSMLDDIQKRKAKRFAECMEKHRNAMQPQGQQPDQQAPQQ